jgi:MFS family permease
MDFTLFSFATPSLLTIWSMSKGEAGLITTVALLTSALGGWAFGILADWIGRVKVLQVTILWYAICTFLCGFAQGPHEMLALRALQGFGFGGEWAAGAVLVGEVVESRFRGRAVGFVQSSWVFGWGMATIISTIILSSLRPDYAWRVLFFIGLFPALLVLLIRRTVPESPLFVGILHSRTKSSVQFTNIFRTELRSLVIRGGLLATGIQAGYYAIMTWMPTFLRTQRHLTIMGSGLYLSFIIFGSLIGYIASAILTDKIGRRLTFIVFSAGSVGVIFVYTDLAINNSEMLLLSLPLGFFSTGVFGGLGAFYTELFPTRIRATAQGFCYNFGRGIAAFFPLLTGLAAKYIPLGEAIALFAILPYGLVILSAMLLPETYGRDIEQLDFERNPGDLASSGHYDRIQ